MAPPSAPIHLILASASPRRRELLSLLRVPFEVIQADIDERPHPAEPPDRYVARVAGEKAAAVARSHPTAVVLAADTSVILNGEILGKPRDRDDACAMLRALSGRTHTVLTAVALDGRQRAGRVVETTVRFRALGEREIAWYVDTGEPLDKAGAYAVQGAGGLWVERVDGSPSNVIGLPLAETVELLSAAGLALPWSER